MYSQPAEHITNKGISELHPLRDARSRKACAHNTSSTGKCQAGMLPHLQGHTAMPGFSGTKSLLLTALFQEIKSLFSLKPDHKNKPKETEHLCVYVPFLVEIQAACKAEVAWSHRTLGTDDLGTVAGCQTWAAAGSAGNQQGQPTQVPWASFLFLSGLWPVARGRHTISSLI